jgi:segregation and condensation protein B
MKAQDNMGAAAQREEEQQAATSDGPSAPEIPPDELKASIEALLYASKEPLSLRELAKALPDASREAIKERLQELVGTYQDPGRGLHIVEVAGGHQITTRPEYHECIGRLFEAKPPSKLSLPALETLAAIAYRQPITVPEIMELRGLHSAGVVRTLLERKLIRILGRKKVVGRPLLYGTTKEFQIRFGLKSLDDLPRLQDMAEVFGDEIASNLSEAMEDLPRSSGTAPDSSEQAGEEDANRKDASEEGSTDGQEPS